MYKTMIIFMLFNSTQNPIELLGQNIAAVPNYKLFRTSSKKDSKNKEVTYHTYESRNNLTFLGENIERFYFKTNAKDTIVEIYFSLYSIASKSNYMELFVDNYGEPVKSFCIGEVTNMTKTTTKEGYATGMEFKPRECDYLTETPFSSIWEVRNNCSMELTRPFEFDTFQKLDIRLKITDF